MVQIIHANCHSKNITFRTETDDNKPVVESVTL